MPGLGRVAARGASVTLGAQGIRFVLQIGSLAVLSRLLTPAEVGLVAMVTAILGVAEIVRDFGLSAAAIQSPTLSLAERSNLFWLNLSIGAGCTVLALLGAPLLAGLYDEPQVVPIVVALAGLFLVSGANTQYRADLSRDLRFGALAVTDVAAQVLSVAVAITAAAHGLGAWAIVLQQVTFVVTTFVCNALQCRWAPRRPDRSVPMGRFLRFGAQLLGTNLMGFAVNNVDNVAIGAYSGATQLGLYSRAYQLLQVPLQQINAPLSRVVLPVLSRVQSDRDLFQHYFQRFQLAICYSLGLGFALLAGVAEPLVHLLLGPAWWAAAPILTVLAVGGVFKGIDSANYQVWVAKGLTGRLLTFYAITRPLMIATILAGLPWGPVGVATGHLVAAVAHWIVGLAYVCRLSGLERRPLFAQSVRTLALVIAPAGALARLGAGLPTGAPGQLACGLAFGLAWAALVAVTVPAVRRDVLPVVSAVLGVVRRTRAVPVD
jgi:PST family polysaccharide transporter